MGFFVAKCWHPPNSTTTNLALAISAAALGGGALWLLTWSHFQQKRKSHEFVEAGQVDQLYIYPIKSCKPNRVDWLDCGERGSMHGEERDRHFLVVDVLQDNLFLTARIYPKMVLIEAHVQNQILTVQFPTESDVQSVNVDLEEVLQKNQIRRARLFNDFRTEGLDCGDQIGRAFTTFLGLQGKRDLRLIWFANDELYTERDQPAKKEYWANNPVPEVADKIGYADLASYMAFSLGSVHDLNGHLAAQRRQIDSRNFRPNLVVSGVPPFDEDRWLRIRVGEAEFVCYKPCTRCILTTVNPDSGEKCEKMEPLKELRKYRLAPGKLYDLYKESPVFGVNMAIVKPGRIRVGDPVWIQYKPKPF